MIEFDISKLNKKDLATYHAMNDIEKSNYEKIWVQIETLKFKQIQQLNKSKERNAREKRTLAERQRKERTHRLIERGALLESFIPDAELYTNNEIGEILSFIFSLGQVSEFLNTEKNTNSAPEQTNEEPHNDFLDNCF